MKSSIMYLILSSTIIMLIGLGLWLYFDQVVIFQGAGIIVQIVCLFYSRKKYKETCEIYEDTRKICNDTRRKLDSLRRR